MLTMTKRPPKKSSAYLQGMMAAWVAVSEITGKQPMDGMSEQTRKLTWELNARLAGLCAAEAERLNDD